MAKHDYLCVTCDLIEEHSCSIADAASQVCSRCGGPVTQLFCPPTQFMTPEAFKHSFSELFGTTSEKDWLKENPHATRVNPSTFRSRQDQDKARWAKASKEAAEVEHALRANVTLTEEQGGRKRKKRST